MEKQAYLIIYKSASGETGYFIRSYSVRMSVRRIFSDAILECSLRGLTFLSAVRARDAYAVSEVFNVLIDNNLND